MLACSYFGGGGEGGEGGDEGGEGGDEGGEWGVGPVEPKRKVRASYCRNPSLTTTPY